jgi:hypothetical protein
MWGKWEHVWNAEAVHADSAPTNIFFTPPSPNSPLNTSK